MQNIKHQIITSGEKVTHILFTGGGARLKNLTQLIKEQLPTYTTRIIIEPSLNSLSDNTIYIAEGAITPTLYGLLNIGKENCCREIMPKEPAKPIQTELFPTEKPQEEEQTPDPEEKKPKTGKKTAKPEKEPSKPFFGGLFGNWMNKGKEALEELKKNMTETEPEGNDE